MKVLMLNVLLFICFTGICQNYYIYRNDTINRTDKNGLKYGYWIYFTYGGFIHETVIDSTVPRVSFEGNLKIIEIFPDQIEKTEENFIRLKDGRYIWYGAKFENKYSVEDGWWIRYNTNESQPIEIWGRDYYINGVHKNSQTFTAGVLDEYKVFYDNRTDTYLSCEPSVFSRWTSRYKGDGGKTIYYPDNILSFSEVYVNIYSTIGYLSDRYVEFYSSLNKPFTIDSICTKNKMLRLSIGNDSTLRSFLAIPQVNYKLKITYNPKPTTSKFQDHDTIHFYSQGSKIDYYKLIVSENCYHLSYKTNLKQILIKKESATNFIMISTCSYSDIASRAEIINSKGTIMNKFRIYFDSPCTEKINIENYEPGIYRVVFYQGLNGVFEQKIIIE